ncbi:hypothetical protein [Pseudoduganella albidiflava]|nr:hypothetical protein [Pseudoduganella albidiflava]
MPAIRRIDTWIDPWRDPDLKRALLCEKGDSNLLNGYPIAKTI